MGIKVDGLTVTSTDGLQTVKAEWNELTGTRRTQTENYYVQWFYNIGTGWFDGPTTTVGKNPGGGKQHTTYSPDAGDPEHPVTGVIAWVTPIALKYKGNNDQETPYYIGETATGKADRATTKPEKIENLSGEIVGNKIKAKAIIENAAAKGITYVRFQYTKDTKQIAVMDIHVVNNVATASYSVDPGGNYQVRAKAVVYDGTTPIYSAAWSDPIPGEGDFFHSAPVAPSGFTLCAPVGKTSIRVMWPGNTGNYNYEIQYTEDSKYFDVSDVVTSDIIESGPTERLYTGMTEGKEYFFRVRAIDKEASDQHSAWSPVSSTKLGEKPGVPTTWSSTSTLSIGQDEPLILYWVHNTVDGSKMTHGYVTCTLNDGQEYKATVDGPTETEEPEKTYFIKVYQTGQVPAGVTQPYMEIPYSDGDTISWFVRTEGIIPDALSDPSITREVRTYAKPNILLSIVGIESEDAKITSYPFRIKMESDVDGQMPITYNLSIVSNSMYETYDHTGKPTTITPGTVIFNKNYDYNTDELTIEMTPDMIDLVSGGEFVIFATVAFDSGLTAESQLAFTTEFVAEEYYVDAEISTNNDDAIAYIRPYAAYYEETDEVPKAYLAVFRRNADGTLVEIDSGLDNEERPTTIDPHPTLDYARYRVIATDKATGIMTVYDTVPIKVGEKAIIIQWDEQWEAFNPERTDEMMVQPYSGSMVRLPYNVDVTENVSLESTFVDYIGREHPVSYYGTHVGETSSWSTVIPKYDTDTLYQLRRLSKWMGNVYVREPSGLGYWASIKLNFSQTHLAVTIPVKIEITRVEGGK